MKKLLFILSMLVLAGCGSEQNAIKVPVPPTPPALPNVSGTSENTGAVEKGAVSVPKPPEWIVADESKEPYFDPETNILHIYKGMVNGYEISGNDLIFNTDQGNIRIPDGVGKIISVWSPKGKRETYKVETMPNPDSPFYFKEDHSELILGTSFASYYRKRHPDKVDSLPECELDANIRTGDFMTSEGVFVNSLNRKNGIINAAAMTEPVKIYTYGDDSTLIASRGGGMLSDEYMTGGTATFYGNSGPDTFYWNFQAGETTIYNYSSEQDKIDAHGWKLTEFDVEGDNIILYGRPLPESKRGGKLIIKDVHMGEVTLYYKGKYVKDWSTVFPPRRLRE